MYTMHARFCTFGTDLYARSALINEISTSEPSRKFIQSALLVGHLVSHMARWKRGARGHNEEEKRKEEEEEEESLRTSEHQSEPKGSFNGAKERGREKLM